MTDPPREDDAPHATTTPPTPGQSPWWIVGASFTGLAMGAMLAGGLIGVLEASEAAMVTHQSVASAETALRPAPAGTSVPDQEADPEDGGDEVLDESVDVDAAVLAEPALPDDGGAAAAVGTTPRAGATPRSAGAAEPIPPAPPRSARSRGGITSDNVPEGPAQGFIRGRPVRIAVTRIDGKPVERHTAGAYLRMRDAAARAGVRLRIVSGFRTMEHQQALYRAYRLGRGNLAAVPGTSNHQSGHALDLNTSTPGVLRWLDRHAREYGFRRTVPTESWHWEYW
jgi:hypothetical protein